MRAKGWSVNGRHIERGYAFTASLEESKAAARKWDQDAVFWFDGTRFWLVPADEQRPPISLPMAGRVGSRAKH
jgi:hypothetical protein